MLLLRGFPGWNGGAIFTPLLTGGSSAQRSDRAVAVPPPGLSEQPDYRPLFPHRDAERSPPRYRSTMADRENLVYQAKLAEQAERYDGKAADTHRS